MRSIDIQTADGTIDALLFTPQAGGGARPPVVLFTDIAGLRPCYSDKAQAIADAGYAVLMPNIYCRTVRGAVMPTVHDAANPMPELYEHVSHLTPEALAIDFAALLEAIGREPEFGDGPVGAIGYCLTGGFPVRLASQFPDRIGAALGFHSAGLAAADNPRAILALIPAVKARVYFGHADEDPYLDAGQIGAVDRALAAAGVHFITEYYRGAAHGFTAADGRAYDAAADALHHDRIRMVLGETIAA